MSDANKDRLEGLTDEAKGRVKSAGGELTGDDSTKGEGKLDQLKGQAKQAMGDAKDKLDDAKQQLDDKSKER